MNRSEVKLPADQIVAARAYVLVLAILGQLKATNNWSRIAPRGDLRRRAGDRARPRRGGVAGSAGGGLGEA